VRTDWAEDDDERPDTADAARARGADAVYDADPVRGAATEREGSGQGNDASADRVARSLEYRADVDAVDRAYAIDQGYARYKRSRKRPSPRPCAASKPRTRTAILTGLEHRLKGKDRLD
jgi:hypothetical protein